MNWHFVLLSVDIWTRPLTKPYSKQVTTHLRPSIQTPRKMSLLGFPQATIVWFRSGHWSNYFHVETFNFLYLMQLCFFKDFYFYLMFGVSFKNRKEWLQNWTLHRTKLMVTYCTLALEDDDVLLLQQLQNERDSNACPSVWFPNKWTPSTWETQVPILTSTRSRNMKGGAASCRN